MIAEFLVRNSERFQPRWWGWVWPFERETALDPLWFRALRTVPGPWFVRGLEEGHTGWVVGLAIHWIFFTWTNWSTPSWEKKKLLAAEYSKHGNLWNGWTGSLAALLGHGIFDIWLIGLILIREKYFSIM